MKFKQITVVGVGLIGGSFALAAKKAQLAEIVLGCDVDPTLSDKACALNVIDGVDEALAGVGVSNSDLVYLAMPVGGIIEFLRTRGRSLKPGAVVTDAGSTKREVCLAAREGLPDRVHFVGGHPMAGSERAGVEFASADLFRGNPYAIVEAQDGFGSAERRAHAANLVVEVVTAIGARPLFISAERHDHVVARVSHAPQLLSLALAVAAAKAGDKEMIDFAGAGFADMTRLAESRWSVWEDICRTNSDEITVALGEILRELDTAREGLASRDLSSVRDAFEAANRFVRNYRQTNRDVSC